MSIRTLPVLKPNNWIQTRRTELRRVLIFGNSGSGKTTLAIKLCTSEGLAHLDLDTLAWQSTLPPVRKPLGQSRTEIEKFIHSNESWVIEGCYTDLLAMAASESNEIVFMKLPVEDCLANARNRPWEPHKYGSKQAQDSNLEMLLDWIAQYAEKQDTFSEKAHKDFFERYAGHKTMFTSNRQHQ